MCRLTVIIMIIVGFTPDSFSDRNDEIINLFQNEYNGEGTYYEATTDGTCTYGSRPPTTLWGIPNIVLVAINHEQFVNGRTCGICLQFEGEGEGLGTDPIKGKFLAFNKDKCPACKTGDLDLSKLGDGRWKIKFHAVQFPVGTTTIQYSFQGSNDWYMKVQVRNARIPITSVHVKEGSTWAAASEAPDGFWTASSPTGGFAGEIHVKLTAANGHEMEDVIPGIQTAETVVVDGKNKVQVPVDPKLPTYDDGKKLPTATVTPQSAAVTVAPLVLLVVCPLVSSIVLTLA